MAIRLALAPSIIFGSLLTVAHWWIYPPLVANQRSSVFLNMVNDSVWAAISWPFAAAALGLAWQHLPGRRGPTKAIPIVFVFSLALLADLVVVHTLGGLRSWMPIVEIAIFALFMLYISLRMDKVTLDSVVPVDAEGNRIQRMLDAYGLGNFSARLTVFLTPVAAVLALWSALQGGDVSYPTVDPMQFPRSVDIGHR